MGLRKEPTPSPAETLGMARFITQDFAGIVILKDWIRWVDGKQYTMVAGRVSIIRDVDLVGFEAKGTESNWAARVESSVKDSNAALTILGCQVRAVAADVLLPGAPADCLVLE